jgi:hypothetical protein
MRRNQIKPRLCVAAAATALALAVPQGAKEQMYSNGPGFYMSLEGRYLKNGGEQMQLSPPATQSDTDSTSSKLGDDKAWGGKTSMDYRFPSNWDIGVSASGLKTQR